MDLLITHATVLSGDPDNALMEDAVIGIKGDRIAHLQVRDTINPLPNADRVINARGKVITPGFVNVHTHAILTMVRGVAEDMGFAPAYTPGVPHGHDVTPDEAVALARLGALEALLFGSTLINDSYVHADETLPAMGEIGGRVFACGRIHDVDFSRVHEQIWEHKTEIGEATLKQAGTGRHMEWKKDGGLFYGGAPDTCSRDRWRKFVTLH